MFAAPFASTLRVDTPISNPYWSPDGKHLTFTVYFDTDDQRERNGLYIAKPDGTGLRRVVAWPEQVESVEWSPDGEEILTGNGLIVKVVDGDTRRVLPLAIVNARRLVPRRITDGRAN